MKTLLTKSTLFLTALTCSVVLRLCPPASAAPGSLDATFGQGGKVITNHGADEYAKALAIQSDGKTVVAGYNESEFNEQLIVSRYRADGALEFRVTASLGVLDRAFGQCVAIQSDGKIIAAGDFFDPFDQVFRFLFVRLLPSGTEDPTLRNLIVPIGAEDDYCRALAIQPDGRILAAGFSANGATNDFALVRLLEDGRSDPSFGTGGKVRTAIGSGHDQAYCMVLQGDGKIVLGGVARTGANWDLALARYHTDGSLDTGFGTNGKVVTPIGTSDDWMYGLAIQSDGKLVATGYATSSGNADVALVRYNANGTLDPTFGTGGKVTTPVGSNDDIAFSVKIASSGKILVAGAANSGRSDFMLLRYLSNGTLDPIFGSGGKAVTRMGSGDNVAYAMGVQNDGHVVLAGRAHNDTDNDIALARFLGFAPIMRVSLENIPGTPISEGQTIDFGVVQRPNGGALQDFIIRNVGDAPLTGISNGGVGEFQVFPVVSSTVAPGGSTHFPVAFAPLDPTLPSGPVAGTLYMNSNDIDGTLSIGLRGFAYSSTLDFDADGLNDWGEYTLSALGFNWQVSQPSLVSALYNNANAANLFTQTQYDANRQTGRNDVTGNPNSYSLYTLTQVQALNVGTPLLTRDAATGKFKLTMALKKSANLTDYQPFPFTDPGTAINAQGEVEFEFTAPGNAAFFRIEAK
jgi:uncharacterized delta-60 repeat protein